MQHQCDAVRLERVDQVDDLGVRDTKDAGRGPILTFTRAEWAAFVGGAKDGEFDL
jgi:hypothetical protein